MRKANKIDAQGLYIEDVMLMDGEATPADCIETPCPGGFWLPRWDGLTETWVEGRTAEEIADIQAANPSPEDLKAQAISEIKNATTIAGLKAAMLKYVNEK